MPSPLDDLGLTDLIKLQDELQRVIRARFERELCLVFTDVVGSTAYLERFGDAAGRALLQRHLDLLGRVVGVADGRIVDTAGDGAFCVFSRLLPAVAALSDLQVMVARDNAGRSAEHHLGLRVGLHFGPVLTDGTLVSGDSVHLAARVSSTADAGQIHLTQSALAQLPAAMRVRCRLLEPVRLKGFSEPVQLASLEWRDPRRFPTRLRIEEAGIEVDLPSQDLVRIGRLPEHEGQPANEVVLTHPDPEILRRISRWQCELHRHADGLFLRSVSRAVTELDGRPVPMGQSVQVFPGQAIRLSSVLTLRLLSPGAAGGDETVIG
ncbi:MAG: adenylate/guanylate cyclase domain-containing protein [Pseudomonadota bacterium]